MAYKHVSELVTAVTNLRTAQREYLQHRGTDQAEEFGKRVGEAAGVVDEVLDSLDFKRLAVFDAIDGERDYQNMRMQRDGSTATDDHPHTPEEFLLYMDHYLGLAKTAASTIWGPGCKPAIMDIVRKVVTLGVAAGEQHGMPQRTPS
jgi:hypothetical protein